MIIGYARVSTSDQNLDLQIHALNESGCEKIFFDKASGKNTKRPEFQKMMQLIRKGDTIIVWKLDRLGRSLIDLVKIVKEFEERGVEFNSLNDPINTTTAHGKFIFQIFAALAEMERNIIRERTIAGLKAARARGAKGGRPKGLSEESKKKAKAAAIVYKNGEHSVSEIVAMFNTTPRTLYRWLDYMKVPRKSKALPSKARIEKEVKEEIRKSGL